MLFFLRIIIISPTLRSSSTQKPKIGEK